MHMSCLLFLNIDTIMNKVHCINIIVNVYEHDHIEVRGQIVTRIYDNTAIRFWARSYGAHGSEVTCRKNSKVSNFYGTVRIVTAIKNI